MAEIYLDNSATTRPYPEVVSLMSQILTNYYGNPSSLHRKGLEAERLVEEARGAVARVLESRTEEIYFTSGGTEANNMAIKGAAYRRKRQGTHLITTTIEHPSVLNCFRQLAGEGFEVTYLPVNEEGYIDLDELAAAIGKETILVSIMHVNNEIGTVQPVKEAGQIIKACNPRTLFHVDGVQSFGKLPVEPNGWQADLFSCSAHKIHGPKGCGALWVKQGITLHPLFAGGGQEQSVRPGTENVAAIAGFGAAATITSRNRAENAAKMYELKKILYHGLQEAGLNFFVNGPPPDQAAPHIINLSFPGIKAEVLVHALEKHEIYTSPGSACHSRDTRPSHVLEALGLDRGRIDSALRFSFAIDSSSQEINMAISHIASSVRELSFSSRT